MVKRVAVINDLSGLGKCSLTAAIPVISVMGVQPCPLPTAVLSNQTGYESYYCTDFTPHMAPYIREWEKRGLTLDGICTGFLGSAAQVEQILSFCRRFRRPDTLLLVDPVMGDRGEAYPICTPEYAAQMRRLVGAADVITPNLTECCMLTGTNYRSLTAQEHAPDYLSRIARMAHPLLDEGISTVIVTGILYRAAEDTAPRLYNLILTQSGSEWVSGAVYGGSYSGTGDLLAAVVCAGMVRGDCAADTVRRAVHFLEASLRDTVQSGSDRNDGICFEPHLSLLLK